MRYGSEFLTYQIWGAITVFTGEISAG